ADAGVVEVAMTCQRLVLLEQRLAPIEREQAGLVWTQALFEALGKIAGDCPVRSSLAWCLDSAAYMADATFGVGDCAFLLTPGGCGKEQIRVAAGFSGEKSFLHHDERAGRERLMDFLLVGQG